MPKQFWFWPVDPSLKEGGFFLPLTREVYSTYLWVVTQRDAPVGTWRALQSLSQDWEALPEDPTWARGRWEAVVIDSPGLCTECPVDHQMF